MENIDFFKGETELVYNLTNPINILENFLLVFFLYIQNHKIGIVLNKRFQTLIFSISHYIMSISPYH